MALWVLVSAQAPAGEVVHRFALVVGNDDGGEGTRPLEYARDDARKLHDIVTKVGGVQGSDAVLLLDATAGDLDAALGELERKAGAAHAQGERTLVFFYFSGHAKDGALRLGSTALPLETLKARLAHAQADVRIAVLDACRSGAVTRTKGVRRAPAFEVENDATRASKGLVILTSSAADEDSQESDAIGGSYFSHHLASGLLGDADGSGDGRVTLSEAYAYAYQRTVADTADSAAGAQHPTFSYDLAGNGDLVLTDVAAHREGVRLSAPTPAGTYFLVDARGFVAAEITKPAGVERVVALSPGRYLVKRRLADRLRVGQLEVREGQLAELDEASLKDTRFSDDPVKGTLRSTLYARHWSFGVTGNYQLVFDAPTTQGGYFPSAPVLGIDVTFHNLFGRGFGLGADGMYGFTNGTLTSGLVTANFNYSLLTLGATVLYEWPDGRLVPYVGVRLGLNLMNRNFPGSSLPSQGFQAFTPGAVLGLKYRISDRWGIAARARVHYLLYNVDETRSFGFAELGAVLTYEARD
ncbi:MAG: caspase family protein [Myxococcaceae bacterium]|nr:caspase family protein [Myxococcaceae bacterium]